MKNRGTKVVDIVKSRSLCTLYFCNELFISNTLIVLAENKTGAEFVKKTNWTHK